MEIASKKLDTAHARWRTVRLSVHGLRTAVTFVFANSPDGRAAVPHAHHDHESPDGSQQTRAHQLRRRHAKLELALTLQTNGKISLPTCGTCFT